MCKYDELPLDLNKFQWDVLAYQRYSEESIKEQFIDLDIDLIINQQPHHVTQYLSNCPFFWTHICSGSSDLNSIFPSGICCLICYVISYPHFIKKCQTSSPNF